MSLGPDPVSSIYDSRLRGNTLKLLDKSEFYTNFNNLQF